MYFILIEYHKLYEVVKDGNHIMNGTDEIILTSFTAMAGAGATYKVQSMKAEYRAQIV